MVNQNANIHFYKNYHWITKDKDILGGQLAVVGTRISVSHVLECLSEGMSPKDIQEMFGYFPIEAMPEIYKVASEFVEQNNHVAA